MPEFDELVERLAKAIHREQYPLARERGEFWETERHQDMYFDFAKAALTALSETHVEHVEDTPTVTVAETAGIARGYDLYDRREAKMYESIGRAVVEWADTVRLPVREACGFMDALEEVRTVIAKAREATPHA